MASMVVATRGGVVGSLLVSILALAGAGCGGGSGSDDSSGLVSCTLSEGTGPGSLEVCEQGPAADRAAFQQACMVSTGGLPDAGVSGTVMNGPCSRVGALGACQESNGGVTLQLWYYGDGSDGETSADIQMLCTSAGETYVAP